MENTVRHGGPFDRGGADSYYGRPCRPHYYVGDTYSSEKVEEDGMTSEEIEAYKRGFEQNELAQNFKEYD